MEEELPDVVLGDALAVMLPIVSARTKQTHVLFGCQKTLDVPLLNDLQERGALQTSRQREVVRGGKIRAPGSTTLPEAHALGHLMRSAIIHNNNTWQCQEK